MSHSPQKLFPGGSLRAVPVHLPRHDLAEAVPRQQEPAVGHHHRHFLRLRHGPVDLRGGPVQLVGGRRLVDVAVLDGDVESVAGHDELEREVSKKVTLSVHH